MQGTAASPRVENSWDTPQLIFQTLCPACGSPLFPLQGFWRCPRCQYRVCEGCEGGTGGDSDP
jgi:hypothetical protein